MPYGEAAVAGAHLPAASLTDARRTTAISAISTTSPFPVRERRRRLRPRSTHVLGANRRLQVWKIPLAPGFKLSGIVNPAFTIRGPLPKPRGGWFRIWSDGPAQVADSGRTRGQLFVVLGAHLGPSSKRSSMTPENSCAGLRNEAPNICPA